MTYRGDVECPDAVLCEVLHLLEGDLQAAISCRPVGWPVLVALHLESRNKVQQVIKGTVP